MQKNGLIDDDRIAVAFRKVDRRHFVADQTDAYIDAPQSIGSNATISAPHMHAAAAQYLLPFLKPGARVLDVGCGSGYTTGLFYALIQPGQHTPVSSASESISEQRGLVVGIDHIPSLTALSARNLTNAGFGDVLTIRDSPDSDTSIQPALRPSGFEDPPEPTASTCSIEIVTGDGRLGYAAQAPYDAIHVGAAAGSGVPPALLEQLAAPGRMFIPVGVGSSGAQKVFVVDKDAEGRVSERTVMDVMYVPLTDREKQEAF